MAVVDRLIEPSGVNPRSGGFPAYAALALLLAAILTGAGCGKAGRPPVKGPQPDQLPVYQTQSGFSLPDSATWNRAKKRGRLVVGVKEDQPYMGEKDPATGVHSGFDIEIARMMSASLGFDPAGVSFRTIASANTYSVCVDNLLTYQVDAVTTDDTILMGYAAKVPDELEIAGKPFSKEPYGIGVPRSDTALRFALDDAIAAHEKNGDWKKAYDATLGMSGVPAPAPPAIDRYPAS